MMIKFKVLRPRQLADKATEPIFILRQDDWNDYSFCTQYHLSFSSPNGGDIHIGIVKILKKGQTDDCEKTINDDFTELGSDFISVGQSIDYYQRISELEDHYKNVVLNSLNDWIKHPGLGKEFLDERGWKKSLFRDFEIDSEMVEISRELVRSDYLLSPKDGLVFSFKMPEWSDSIEFNFSKNKSWFVQENGLNQITLPSRIFCIIGQNGSGKSTLLSRIARVAFGTKKERADGEFSKLGEISPIGIGFSKVITISYSAFDSFKLPGVQPFDLNSRREELFQIIKDVKNGTGRFIFCGLRDIAAELEEELHSNSENETSSDRNISTKLKSIGMLADEFSRTIRKISSNSSNYIFYEALRILSSEGSFDCSELKSTPEAKYRDLFLKWSTGHKIAVQILASLTAHTKARSLVLMDEPETHLHPPLLASLMQAVRYILDKKTSFSIIATHSPVVLQETMTKNVSIIRSTGESATLYKPLIQTYGESIGLITSEVFGLSTTAAGSYGKIHELSESALNFSEIEEMFHPQGLSQQSLAYLLSKMKNAQGK